MSEPLNMIKENIDTGYDCVDAKEAYNISDNRIDFFHEIGVITDDEKQKWKEYNSIKFNESKYRDICDRLQKKTHIFFTE